MKFQVMKLTSASVLSFEPYISDSGLTLLEQGKAVALGLLDEKGYSCGAIVCRVNLDEKSVFIESICVDEKLRRQGGGTLLVTGIIDMIKKSADTLVCRLVPQELTSQQAFWMNCGFESFTEGEIFYSVSKDMIKEWFTSDLGKKMSKLAKKTNGEISHILAKDSNRIHQLTDFDYDATLSYGIYGPALKGCVLATYTDSEQNNLLVSIPGAINASPQEMAILLHTSISDYGRLLTNEGRLFFKAEKKRDEQLWKKMFPQAEILSVLYGQMNFLDRPEEITMHASSLAIPRLNALADILDQAGYEYEASFDDVSNPSVRVIRKPGSRPVSLECEIFGNYEANLYCINIFSSFAYDSLLPKEQKKLSIWNEKSGLCSVLWSKESNLVRVSASVLDGPLVMDEPLFLTFFETFLKEVDELKAAEEAVVNPDYKERDWEEEE